MKSVQTNFIDRAAENTIVCLSGDYYKLQGFLLKTEVNDNDYISHDTYPVVGPDMMIVDEFVANDLGVEEIECCIIGHSGDTVHITDSGISLAIFCTGFDYHNRVGDLLWGALDHGIKFSAEGVDKVIPIVIRKDSNKDYYHIDIQHDSVPLHERHLRKSRILPIPAITLDIGSVDKSNNRKYTLPEFGWALKECIGAYSKYFNLEDIRIKFHFDKSVVDKHHKEFLRRFERFFNKDIADKKNLPYC